MKKITLLTFFMGCIVMAQPDPENAVTFNGIDQFIIMPDSDNINTTTVSNRTIETYFKVNDATNRQVFYKEGAQVNTIKFYVENGNLIVGSYRNNGGPNHSIWFRTPVNNDTWYHVALVLDNASRLLFYLNGELQATNENYFELPNHPGNFEIARTQGPARYPNCSTWGSNGLVDECLGDVTNTDNVELFFGGSISGFRIWDDVRTADEIMMYKNSLITDPESPIGEGLLAFLEGYTMSFQDDNGNFDTEDAQGVVLSLDELTVEQMKVYVENGFLEVDLTNSMVPDRIELFDLIGKSVGTRANASRMAVHQRSEGIYILKIQFQGRSVSRKVLLNKRY